ncbi:MAG TPA: hypothetical protein VM555_08990 [Tahibacter sp.]|jgi:hypothetical protein|nr:hypothetical protein [Tahibacter sp.]
MKPFPSFVLYAALAACAASAAADPSAVATNDPSYNPMLFPLSARPYGASLTTWAERETAWLYSIPASRNPQLDQTGADCGVGQSGPVWFLPPIAGPDVMDQSRTCTIPRGKAILLDIGHVAPLYPCPNRAPDPGESVAHFLFRRSLVTMSSVDLLDVSLNGQPVQNVLHYRFISEQPFVLKGDASLTTELNACITGGWQAASADGFFMLFRPLSPGAHTIVVRGTNTFGDDKTYRYYLTQL